MMERKRVEQLRELYPKGMKIRCLSMNDPYPILDGTIGTVSFIDDAGTIHMQWENGSTLGLVEGVDQFEIVSEAIH